VDAGAASAIIIGAGTIGAELASTLAQRGLAVTVVDLAPQPMQRFFSGHLGEEAKAWMHSAGVVTHFGVAVESIQKTDAAWTVQVSGLDLHADLVISAVGARPNTEWLTYSDLDISNGVRCTADGKALLTSGEIADGIFAIGDVSARQAEDGTFRRFESWTQAQRHGAALAEYFAGFESMELEQAPYGWTEQFGRKVQVHGMLPPEGELVQVYAAEERNAALYRIGSAEEEAAWIGVNAPRQFSRASMGMSLLS
jgi:3-phenylpropionate/trans-cinnamate dioxygenase ferredoxin reductase subunit